VSSQGRTKRQTSDYYATPGWAIDELLSALTEDSGPYLGDDLSSHDLIVLDPCAGGDANRGMAYPDAIQRFGRWDVQRLGTVDIREDSRAEIKGDYIHTKFEGVLASPDIIITNPPFKLAVPIIRHALHHVREGGLVVMLQRLNFFGSQERRKFWAQYMPVLCYVHHRRMRFLEGINPETGNPWPGDSIEYAHYVWQRGNNPKFTKLRVL
jgi:hypothetical protein